MTLTVHDEFEQHVIESFARAKQTGEDELRGAEVSQTFMLKALMTNKITFSEVIEIAAASVGAREKEYLRKKGFLFSPRTGTWKLSADASREEISANHNARASRHYGGYVNILDEQKALEDTMPGLRGEMDDQIREVIELVHSQRQGTLWDERADEPPEEP